MKKNFLEALEDFQMVKSTTREKEEGKYENRYKKFIQLFT